MSLFAAPRPQSPLLRLRRPFAVGAAVLVAGATVVSLAAAPTAAAGPSVPSTSAAAPVGATNGPIVGFPAKSTTGVPDGWTPKTTSYRTVRITQPGAVVADLRVVDADIEVAAPNVTLRRVEVVGGDIDNWAGSACSSGMRVFRSTVRRSSSPTSGDSPSIGAGGYVARRVQIDGMPEGFRVGGKSQCGEVRIYNSWARVVSPDRCGDWHGDGIQGYDGGRLTVRNTVLHLVERDGCGGTAPFFYPRNQANTSVDIDGLVVGGGGFAFRLGMPGTVRNLHIVEKGWFYGPIDVNCPAVSGWKASISRLDENGQPVPVRTQSCGSSGGF